MHVDTVRHTTVGRLSPCTYDIGDFDSISIRVSTVSFSYDRLWAFDIMLRLPPSMDHLDISFSDRMTFHVVYVIVPVRGPGAGRPGCPCLWCVDATRSRTAGPGAS